MEPNYNYIYNINNLTQVQNMRPYKNLGHVSASKPSHLAQTPGSRCVNYNGIEGPYGNWSIQPKGLQITQTEHTGRTS